MTDNSIDSYTSYGTTYDYNYVIRLNDLFLNDDMLALRISFSHHLMSLTHWM